MIANRFRQRAVAQLALEHRLQLRVAAGYCITHHHEVDIRGDVVGRVARERLDPFRDEEITHRRIHLLIRALHLMATALEQRRECRHRGTADTDQVDTKWTIRQRQNPRSR